MFSPLRYYSLIRPSDFGEVCPTCTLDVQVFDTTLLRRISQDALAELKSLANIIQSSVAQIEAVATSNSLTLPSSESTFTFESEGPRMHPDIQSAGMLIASAAAQITTLVRPTPLTLLDTTMQVSLEVSRAAVGCGSPGNDEVPCLYRATHCLRDPCTRDPSGCWSQSNVIPFNRFTTAIDLLLHRESTSRKLLSPPTSNLGN